jgi:glycerol-3-phosphate acyltransferase PlsY
MHRSVGTVALVSGVGVLVAFIIGSIPLGYLLSRRQLRRDLRRLDRRHPGPEAELAALLTGSSASGTQAADLPSPADLAGALLDTIKVLGLAALVGVVVHHVGPGIRRGEIPSEGAVGFLSDQVLTAWQSAALWAGMAAVVGHLCPVYLGFRAGQGQAPALALALRYLPFGFSAAVAAFLVGLAATHDVRRAVLISLPAFVAYAWLAWIYDLPHSYGAPNGPELALWAAVLAGVVGARTLGRAPAQ